MLLVSSLIRFFFNTCTDDKSRRADSSKLFQLSRAVRNAVPKCSCFFFQAFLKEDARSRREAASNRRAETGEAGQQQHSVHTFLDLEELNLRLGHFAGALEQK